MYNAKFVANIKINKFLGKPYFSEGYRFGFEQPFIGTSLKLYSKTYLRKCDKLLVNSFVFHI